MNSIIESRDIDRSHPAKRFRASIIPPMHLVIYHWIEGHRYFFHPPDEKTIRQFLEHNRLSGYGTPTSKSLSFQKPKKGKKNTNLLLRAGVLDHLQFAPIKTTSHHGNYKPS